LPLLQGFFINVIEILMKKVKIILNNNVLKEYRKLIRLCRDSIYTTDTDLVRQAFTIIYETSVSCEANEGEQIIIDSLRVAQIVLEEIGLGTIPAVSAIMYKFVKAGKLSTSLIEKEFGKKVVTIIEELANIKKYDTLNSNSGAENFRKLFLSQITDIRVVLIKLADRLYLMRTIFLHSIDKQKILAKETMDIYAPLAHRLGLYNLKSELDDHVMRCNDPFTYNDILQKLQDTASKRNKMIRDFITPVKKELLQNGIDFDIKGRTKSVYSIWNKMIKQKLEFEEVYDVFAIRVIINSESKNEKIDCWKVFSIITNMYPPNLERMRDWITVPKANGYEALHTTVHEPGGKWIEVQIRTKRMDEIAEKGFAAHWIYKGQTSDDGLDKLMNRMREALEKSDPHALESPEHFRMADLSNEIFVFTPKGDLRRLPVKSTVLDFAFDIHSDVGNTCIGAKINNKNVPIRQELKNGDRVEISTSKIQKPKSDWLEFVVTSKAKTKIKQALNEELMLEADTGKETLKRRLRNWKIPFNDRIINDIIKYLKFKNATDLYFLIATNKIDLTQLKEIIVKLHKNEPVTAPDKIGSAPLEKVIPSLSQKPEESLIIDEKVDNLDYKLSKCCSPIFGDDIYGFVTVNDGIKIHRLNCPNASQMLQKYGYRVIKARWIGTDSKTFFKTGLKVKGVDDIGILSRITDVISKDMKVNVQSVNLNSGNGYFEGIIKLFVKDTQHLDALINKLLKLKGVENVIRVDVV
jgi:GTP pyrophosphokinase